MLQMLKSKKDDDELTPSAFSPTGKSPPQAGSLGKSPVLYHLLTHNACKRDSGYGTDFSPASNTSQNKFMYDDSESTDLPEMDDFDSEVFDIPVNDVIKEETESDDSDDTDKEVEELTGGGDDLSHSVSQPIQIKRPSAPIPTPEENGEGTERADSSSSEEDLLISATFNHTRWSNMPRNKFRPIASRSVGTQTPSPHSQVIAEAMGPFGSPRMSRVATLTRLRVRSNTEEIPVASLPDVIPMSRDRSISLPDVPSFRRREHEQDVGRELRRISDEFNSSFTPVRRRRASIVLPASFPLRVNIDISAFFAPISRFISSSPVFQSNQDQRNARPTDRRNDFFH